jgi:hypothetical protein
LRNVPSPQLLARGASFFRSTENEENNKTTMTFEEIQ